jgi:hypothetical protein
MEGQRCGVARRPEGRRPRPWKYGHADSPNDLPSWRPAKRHDRRYSGRRSVAEVDPRLVELCREYDLPLIAGGEVNALAQGQLGRVDAGPLAAAEAAWAAGQEEYRHRQQEAMLVGVLRDYRTERGKEVRRGG